MATLARFEQDFADDAGNLLAGNVTVEVRREGGGLVQLFSDRDGADALGNPFVNVGGKVAFHCIGGAYRITVTQGAYSRTLRYRGIGTNQEIDQQTLIAVQLGGLMQLLYSDETDSSEQVSSTAEGSALKSYSLPANDYDTILIEAETQSRLEQDAQTRADYTWRFKAAGATVTNGTVVQRLTADSATGTDSGQRIVSTISVAIAGGQSVATVLGITAQMSASNAAIGALVKKFRVYGIKDQQLQAMVGPEGPEAPTGKIIAMAMIFGGEGMAAPNIVNVATITAKTKGLALTTSAQDLLENTAASGKVLKVNTIRATNVDGTNAADVTLSFVDASPSATSRLAYTIPVPADAALVLLDKSDAIYLEEGDKLTAFASASGDIELVVSYEELS